jgi:hypothetical protein
MIDKMTNPMYNDPCTIALSKEQQYRDTLDWDDILSPDEYLDHLDKRLYERSNRMYD